MVQLFNDDCLKILSDFEKNNITVDYSFTSPPYNRKRNDKYSFYNDARDDWFEFNCKVIDRLLKITKKHIFYNLQANYYNRSDVYKLIGKYSDKIKDIHIWQKTNPMPARGFSVTNSVEYFLIIGENSLKSNFTYTKNILSTSVNSKMPKEHKAVMKQEVADHFIKNYTKENDIILDCFMGIGTTGISCINLNRKFIGIELNENYFNACKNKIKEEINVLDNL